VVDAEDVANRIAVAVQDKGGHGLLLLEQLNLVSELQHLPLQVVFFLNIIPVEILGLRGGEIADHGSHANQQAHAEYSFEHSLPEGAYWLFAS
jgi:hypothetical protein